MKMYVTEQKSDIVRKGEYYGQTAAQDTKPDIHGFLSLAETKKLFIYDRSGHHRRSRHWQKHILCPF
jgi:hypothetical protein